MATTTFSVLSNDAPNVWIAQETYRLSEQNLRIGKYAKRHSLVQRMGTTLRVIRHSRLNLPTTALTEGTAPSAVALAIENVDVTVEQWGIVVLLTDVSLITTKHPALQVAINRTALAMSEVLEREQAVVLLAGTNVFYGGDATTRQTLAASDVMNTAVIIKASVNLRTNGAGEQEGGLFGGVMSPQQEGDVISSDQKFADASNFTNVRKLEFGEIGTWAGVRWARGNFLPIFEGIAAPGAAAATASVSKAVANASPSDGTFAGTSPLIVVISRDITNDYERKISQTSAAITVADLGDNVDVTVPSSANYVYDVYCDGGSAGTMTLFSARNAASAVASVTGKGTGAVAPAAPASGRTAYVAWLFGKDSFGRVELNGMSMQSFITPAGPSFSNPLAQGRKVGSKIMWKAFIIDDNFFARIETDSAFANGLPA